MISKINISNIKIHKQFNLEINKKISLLFGKNGIGKTSVLEAISLFTIGKGIFNLNNIEILKEDEFYFKAIITTNEKEFELLYNKTTNKKEIYFSKTAITTTTILDHIKIFGISPYTSLAFWNDIELRRKIINRIIVQYNSSYANCYKEYSNILKKRNFLIKNNAFNTNWREILDPILQKNGQKINKIRHEIIQNHINNTPDDIKIFLKDDLIIEQYPNFQDQENILQNNLELNFQGPHLTKFILKTKNTLQTSTGQEKKLLLSLLIMNAKQNLNSILLLDDVFTNLDHENINELIELLSNQNFQTIITHTNKIDNINIENIEIKSLI